MGATREPIEGVVPHPGFGNDGETSVYRIYDRDKGLLYVGMGRNPENRWASHAERHAWWSEAASFRVEWYATRKEAAAEELRAIRSESPKHNVHSSPGWGQFVAEAYPKRIEANRRMLAELRKSTA
jgi:predicted GIY-YIG superfamily endonuclease